MPTVVQVGVPDPHSGKGGGGAERSGGEMMANVPTWHGRSWSMRLWLASTAVIIPEVSDPSWDPSPAESAPFAQSPLLDVLQVRSG